MLTKNVKTVYSVVAIAVTAFVAIVIFHVNGISVNSDMTRLLLSSTNGIINRTNSNPVNQSPRLESVTIGNNGKTQIRGYATADWLFEGQASVDLIKDGTSIETMTCYAEGTWMAEGDVPFLCETDWKIENGSFSIKMSKSNPSGLPENDQTVTINLN